MRYIGITALLLLSTFAIPASTEAQTRGYVERACGFDMDRDGIFGEAEDCNVCDGVTADPDGDGTNEDLIYVSCPVGPFAAGSDTSTCGSPGNPCASIGYAWTVRADGPGDGAEDIICFRNTCSEFLIGPGDLGGGVPGTYTIAKTGSQERDWQYPSNPSMLVGWDVDNDGVYPPADTDDHATLDGTAFNALDIGTPSDPLNVAFVDDPRNKNRAFELMEEDDYVEIAHMRVENYGKESDKTNTGLISFPTSGNVDYLFMHDLATFDINRDKKNMYPAALLNPPYNLADLSIGGSTVPTFNFFRGQVRWANFTNIDLPSNIVWVARGVGGNGTTLSEEGPLRWQNITAVMDSCAVPADPTEAASGECARFNTNGWKLWNYISKIEILDSILDVGLTGRTLSSDNIETVPNSFGIIISQCSQDWVTRNTKIEGFKVAFLLQVSDDRACRNAMAEGSPIIPDGVAPRPVTGIKFDRNFINSNHLWNFGQNMIQVENEDANLANQQLGTLEITNNFIFGAVPYDSCMFIHPDHPSEAVPADILIAHNTCWGNADRFGAISIGDVEKETDRAFLPQKFTIVNNIVGGIQGSNDMNAQFTYVPNQLVMDNNVYQPNRDFELRSGGTDGNYTFSRLNLTDWQAATGHDVNATRCDPVLEDEANGDLHLNAADTCAIDRGVVIAGITDDFDGDTRPQGAAPDVGADETAGGPPPVPDADLQLIGRGGPTTTVVNGLVRLSLMAVHRGPDTAPNTVATVNIPAGLSYLGSSCGAPAPSAGVWSWRLGSLSQNVGTRAIPRCLISLRANSTGGQSITGSISSDANDPVPGNNAFTINVNVN